MNSILFISAHCLLFANAQLLYSPLNAAVLSGEPTEMNCNVNPDSHTIVFCSWEFIRSGSIEESTIYTPALRTNKAVTSFELRHQSNSSCDLIAKEVQLRDAGLYICNTRLKNAINGSTTIEHISAQLIVLESKPYCSRDVEAVNRRCSVFYRGNWPPVIEWRRNNGQTIPGVMSHGAHGNISNTLDDKENAAYTCVVHFSTYLGNISMTARNTPSNSFTCPSRHTESASAPANTAVIKGNNVRLLCKTQKGWPVHSWTFMAAGSTTAERIYDGIEPAAKQHTFEFGHGSFDLSIRPTHLKDAGVYACNKKSIIGGEEKNVQSSAHLIVLEANPYCGVEAVTGNSTEETFRLWCSVRYRGSWTPVMEWRQDAEDGLRMHDVQNITVPNNEVTYILTIVARFAKKNTVYFCRTFFSKTLGSFAFVSATNVPEYSHLWTSPPINHSSEIPLLTMIVTLVGIFLLMFVALTVYHVFFKRMIAGRLKKQNVANNMQPGEGNQQPDSYAAIQDDTTRIEPETLEPEYEENILETTPNHPSRVYNEMGPNATTRPHCYSRLSSTPPLSLSMAGQIEHTNADSTMINDNETHHYANVISN